MKIYHISTKGNLEEIKKSGVIKATPQLVPCLNDWGEQDWEWRNRAYFCLDREPAEFCRSALEYYYGERYAIGEFQVDDDLAYYPDPNFKGVGYYSKIDIKIKEN